MNSLEIAKKCIRTGEIVWDACGVIQEGNACCECPLANTACIDEGTIAEFANFVTIAKLTEFLDFAEDVEEHLNELDFESYMQESKGACDPWED